MLPKWPAAPLLALIACACRGGSPPLPPNLTFVEATHDAGRVEAGSRLHHRFTFTNTGGLELSIGNLRTACECTASVHPRTIKPGEQGAIDVGCETNGSAGLLTRTITVYSNDPGEPFTTLSMSANIDAQVVVDPPRLYVGHCQRGQIAPGSARVVAIQPAVVTAVVAEGTVIDPTLGDGGDPATKRVRVMIKKDAPSGRFEESFVIHIAGGHGADLRVPVIGVVDDNPAS